jgi:hypothetical protein
MRFSGIVAYDLEIRSLSILVLGRSSEGCSREAGHNILKTRAPEGSTLRLNSPASRRIWNMRHRLQCYVIELATMEFLNMDLVRSEGIHSNRSLLFTTRQLVTDEVMESDFKVTLGRPSSI